MRIDQLISIAFDIKQETCKIDCGNNVGLSFHLCPFSHVRYDVKLQGLLRNISRILPVRYVLERTTLIWYFENVIPMKIVCCVPPHAACDFLFLDSAEHSSLCTAGSSSLPLIRYSHQPPKKEKRHKAVHWIFSLLRLLSSENEVKSFTFSFSKLKRFFCERWIQKRLLRRM